MKNKSKICFVAYAPYAPDARIKNYVNYLNEENINIDMICLADDFTTKHRNEYENIKFHFAGRKYQGESAFLYLLSYFMFFIKTFALVTFLQIKNQFKIFHVHNQPDLLVFTALVPKLFGSKILLDMHDIMIAMVQTKFNTSTKNILYRLTKLQTLLAVKFSDVLITADHSQLEFLAEHSIVKKESYVFLNLPNPHYFQFISESQNKNGVLKLVYHGTISKRLGLDLAVKAIEKLREKLKLTFTIIGDGELRPELEEYCLNKGLTGNQIYFKDMMPVEKLLDELKKCDIGLVANRSSITTERCMLPGKLLEYVSMGLPVIVPRLKIIERYFSDDMVCFYNPEDVNDLCECILSLADDDEWQKQLLKNSLTFFDKYSVENQQKVYVSLISNNLK